MKMNTQTGVGLIEVLVAVLIFAVGMMGMMGMQLSAKRATYEAEQRSIATGMVRDIVERIRSNPTDLDAYVITNAGDPNDPVSLPDPNCAETDCTPAQLAAYDIAEWQVLLQGGGEKLGATNAGGLVAPRACISRVDNVVTVAIAWLGINSADNPAESDCGNNVVGLYDDPDEPAGNNLRRRLLVVSAYVGDI